EYRDARLSDATDHPRDRTFGPDDGAVHARFPGRAARGMGTVFRADDLALHPRRDRSRDEEHGEGERDRGASAHPGPGRISGARRVRLADLEQRTSAFHRTLALRGGDAREYKLAVGTRPRPNDGTSAANPGSLPPLAFLRTMESVTSPPEVVHGEASLWEDFVDIYYAPRQVFERRVEGGRWGIVLLIVTAVMALLYFAG